MSKIINTILLQFLLLILPLSIFSIYSFFIKKSTNDTVLKNKTFITFNNKKISDSLHGKDLAFYSYYVLQKNKNAKIMYLLSSEKFFKNSTWGTKQYNKLLKLRCIENKIPMIKSSNYGSSLVINSKGKVLFKSINEFNVFKQ